jgi:hypothetical protein
MTGMTNWSARCGASRRDLAIRALSFNVKTPLFLIVLEIAHREQLDLMIFLRGRYYFHNSNHIFERLIRDVIDLFLGFFFTMIFFNFFHQHCVYLKIVLYDFLYFSFNRVILISWCRSWNSLGWLWFFWVIFLKNWIFFCFVFQQQMRLII